MPKGRKHQVLKEAGVSGDRTQTTVKTASLKAFLKNWVLVVHFGLDITKDDMENVGRPNTRMVHACLSLPSALWELSKKSRHSSPVSR